MSLCTHYDGLVASDSQVSNITSGSVSACSVQTRSLFVNGSRVLPQGQTYIADKYPNWDVVNFSATVPAAPTASYPSGTPLVPYTVPDGRLALIHAVFTEGEDDDNSIGYSILGTDGRRYFASAPGGDNHYEVHLILDEGDRLEWWNDEDEELKAIGSVLEFDKTSINGCRYVLLRGTNDDFPISYTVPPGHTARISPFQTGGGEDGEDINETVIFGTDRDESITFCVKTNGICGPSLSLSGDPEFDTGDTMAPISLFASGTTVSLETDAPGATNQSGYTCLIEQDMSFTG